MDLELVIEKAEEIEDFIEEARRKAGFTAPRWHGQPQTIAGQTFAPHTGDALAAISPADRARMLGFGDGAVTSSEYYWESVACEKGNHEECWRGTSCDCACHDEARRLQQLRRQNTYQL